MIPSPSLPFRFTASLLTCAALSAAALGCGASAGAGATDASEKGGLVGSKAPEFTAEPVTGDGPTNLKDALGKVVILDFWATFCGPCKKSFPKYQELADQYGGDMTVIAVSLDEADNTTKEQIQDFAKNAGVKFAIVWDKDQSVAKKYTPPKMPTSFIIDKEGVIRHQHSGYETGEETKISEEIKALIGK
jgi:cytochrome c biogenesis protein CcmG, thiol:disulfide interchange protein DsbE